MQIRRGDSTDFRAVFNRFGPRGRTAVGLRYGDYGREFRRDGAVGLRIVVWALSHGRSEDRVNMAKRHERDRRGATS